MLTIAHRGSQAPILASGSRIASMGAAAHVFCGARAGAKVVFHDRRNSPDGTHHSPNRATWLAIAP